MGEGLIEVLDEEGWEALFEGDLSVRLASPLSLTAPYVVVPGRRLD